MGAAISAALGVGASIGVVTVLRQITAFRRPFQDGFANRGWSISMILIGGVEYEDETGEHAVLQAGQTFQRIPGRFHRTTTIGGNPIDELVIYIMAPTCHALAQTGIFPANAIGRAVGFGDLLLLAAALKECRSVFATPTTPIQTMSPLLHLLTALCPQDGGNHRINALDRARHMLANDRVAALAISDVARAAGMSQSAFRQKFQEAFGISPSRFRLEERMKHACSYLADGLDVNEVADRLDYEDAFAFSKTFKHFFGYPPKKLKVVRTRRKD